MKLLILSQYFHPDHRGIALYSTDFAVFPSRRETLGLVLVEACKMGKVIITSDLEVLKDVVKPSLVFNPNAIDDIAKNVNFALNNCLTKAKLILKNDIDSFVKLLIEL